MWLAKSGEGLSLLDLLSRCGLQELGVDPKRCVVIEDSRIGLAAAKAAGMR
jgi:beta-phosphoglucomutase-like phosphatase (HAD superfamily)